MVLDPEITVLRNRVPVAALVLVALLVVHVPVAADPIPTTVPHLQITVPKTSFYLFENRERLFPMFFTLFFVAFCTLPYFLC